MGERILVPFDGSEHSRRALDRAFSVDESAEVVVLHVLEPAPDRAPDDEPERRTDRIVEGARAVAETHGREIETVELRGNPGTKIVEYAAANDIDEIVMGSRGRAQPDGTAPGSVANAVIERAPVTVTIVR